jgi:uncharacterized repeat protein (TIGR03806 family)
MAARPCRPPADPEQPPEKLSRTGCVNPSHPLEPGPGALLYQVASPLWSDGADKQRWLFLPDGARLGIDGEGHLQLPAGAVLMKSFSIAGRRVETRLITRQAEGWGVYSYRWADDEADATVLTLDDGAVAREIAGGGATQLWTYPSRTDCRRCHVDEAGFQLGLDLVQLDMVIRYPDGSTANQLDRWQQLDLFETALPRPRRPALPLPTGTQGTLEARARSYLHANCSICHRPESNFPLLDLRWTTTLSTTGACNTEPSKGNLGVAGAKLIVPGQPARSVLSLRMHTLEARFRMPPIGSAVVDAEGVKVIDDWIASLPPCPPR